MRRATYAALSAVALLFTGEARAVTGNQLHEACQGADTGFCMGYVLGAYEASALLGVGICIPAGVSNNQLRDVVKHYLQDNPDSRHASASAQVWAALRTAFPC